MVKVSAPALTDSAVYVPGLPREHVAERYRIPLDNIAKLGSAENPHGPSPKAVAALAQADLKLDIYPDWTAKPLREAIGRRYGFDPDCVVCGSGETEVISLVIRAFAAPGETILMVIAHPFRPADQVGTRAARMLASGLRPAKRPVATMERRSA